MFYTHYRGRCQGRIIYFLHAYLPYYEAENSLIGNGKIMMEKQVIATYEWSGNFGEKDVPIFKFLGKDADKWEQNQLEMQRETIDQSVKFSSEPDPEYRKPVSEEAIEYFIADGYRRAMIMNGVDRDHWKKKTGKPGMERPIFYTYYERYKGNDLYFETNLNRYLWDKEIGDWLMVGEFPLEEKC